MVFVHALMMSVALKQADLMQDFKSNKGATGDVFLVSNPPR